MNKGYRPFSMNTVPQLPFPGVVDNQGKNAFIPPTLTLDNLTPEQLSMVSGRLQDLLLWREVDSFRLDAKGFIGTTPEKPVRLFTEPIGSKVSVPNNTTLTYTKQRSDTTLESDLLARGRTFFVQSIQVMASNVNANAVYPFAPGEDGVQLPQNPGNLIGWVQSASIAMESLFTQGHLVFHVGEKDYERGPLYTFPSRYGFSGVSGYGSEGRNEGTIFNNGHGKPVLLPIARTIASGRNFWVDIAWDHPLELRNNVRFDVILEGLMLRSVQ
jgi:hypothetical protein